MLRIFNCIINTCYKIKCELNSGQCNSFFLHSDQFITLREKKEHAQAVFDHLVNEKKTCEERIYEEEQRYKTLFNMRQNTLASIKVSIILGPF